MIGAWVNMLGTHEDERTVLFKTISLDGTKPHTNPKINPKTNPNHNSKLTLILTFQLFYAFFEHRPLIFSPAKSAFNLYTNIFSEFMPHCIQLPTVMYNLERGHPFSKPHPYRLRPDIALARLKIGGRCSKKSKKQLNMVSISVSLGLWLVLGLVLELVLGLMPSSDIVLKSTVLSYSCIREIVIIVMFKTLA